MCSKHLLGGSSIKVKTPDITQVAPTPQIVSQNEVTDSTGDEEAAGMDGDGYQQTERDDAGTVLSGRSAGGADAGLPLGRSKQRMPAAPACKI